jgi:hypothetical protein
MFTTYLDSMILAYPVFLASPFGTYNHRARAATVYDRASANSAHTCAN